MPYTVDCTPAPLTFTIRPKLDWRNLLSIVWIGFVAYRVFTVDWRNLHLGDRIYDVVFMTAFSAAALLSFIRRERIEIYSDEMVWRWTYFGFTATQAVPLVDVLGAEWNEGEQEGRHGKGPDYVEFYLPDQSIKSCFGFTFDDFDRMREDIRKMYPALVNRWGSATVRSKDLTLLNLT